MKEKIRLYLTDITLHHRDREFREAKTLEKTIKRSEDGMERGRIYMNHSLTREPDGRFTIQLRLPEELQKRIDAGEIEVELMIPKDGIPMLAGRDVEEKIAQMKEEKRLKLAHSCQVWKKV